LAVQSYVTNCMFSQRKTLTMSHSRFAAVTTGTIVTVTVLPRLAASCRGFVTFTRLRAGVSGWG